MRLTHIKLAGFKSFTDPTTIHVPGQLVAVIGPNGCGKSNVIDAVRWVLGEASAKQLRGESMQDVIFNGAATRRPAPRASVELVFDNGDHSLQGAWGQYAEVSIRRQLTRQGESSYYINGQPVRRRDITDLFLGTGVGARGYAVIEQGMISRIIEARPEELRAYIEEAAGVSKYKERRRETESRLKDTREHLQRLGDLQGELARQVEKLHKQAEAAERYRALSDELQHSQNRYDFARWRQALADADAAEAEHEQAQAGQDSLAERQQELNEAVQTLRAAEAEQQEAQNRLNREHALLREQSARLEEQIRSRQNQRQRIERDRTAMAAAVQKIDHEQKLLHEQAQALADEAQELEAQLALLAEETAACEERLPELEAAQQQGAAARQNQQDEAGRIRRELAVKQQQLQYSRSGIAQIQARQSRLQQEAAALNLPAADELAAAQLAAAEIQAQYQTAEQVLQALEQQSGSLKTDFQAAQAAAGEAERRLLALQAEQQTLRALTEEAAAGDFWQGRAEAAAPALWQHIRVPQQWQAALAAVLGERLHARALPPDFAPAAPLAAAPAAWFDREAAAPQSARPAQALLNQIQAEKPFQAALNHWLAGVLCAPDLDYALANRNRLAEGECWLTPEGHRIDRIGVLLHHAADAARLMRQQSRLAELDSLLADAAPAFQAAAERAQSLSQQYEALDAEQRRAQAEQRRLAAELNGARQQAGEMLARTNQGQLRREHIEQELAQLAQEAEELAYTAATLEDDAALLTESAAGLNESHAEAEAVYRGQQQALKQAQLALLEANRRHGAAEIAVHRSREQQQSLRERIAALEAQKADWQERQSELELVSAEEPDESEQYLRLEELGETMSALDNQIQAATAALAATRAEGQAQYQALQDLSASQPQWQAAAQNALLKQQEALLNAKHFHDALTAREAGFDELAAEFEREGSLKDAGSLKDLPQQIERLNNSIRALGAVNLAALDELAEARERDDYYRSQSEDVQAAIALLEEAIAQIDQETKERFKTTFDAVNEKVRSFFPTLFGGGEAALHMVGDDLLSAGVSIMARPPGKKNSTIHLLSGGEKALTAMSLVFALFSLNPAPFCLLDEVDAPLDDANTTRFCNLVKEMSAQTQFLYISHNRLTMEMAEQLIGVTMQEKGVSRIVAVDIKQALQMAEAA